MLADSTCAMCTIWQDGDPGCVTHGGTYGATGDVDHIVIVCRRGAAYVCFTCEDGKD